MQRAQSCLNPCCSGRCSSTAPGAADVDDAVVLILVVVEDVLVPHFPCQRYKT